MRKKVLLVILLLIVIVIVCLIVPKIIIKSKLEKKFDTIYNSQNIYYVEKDYSNSNTKEIWLDLNNDRALYKNIEYQLNDDNLLVQYTYISKNEDNNYVDREYEKEDNKIVLVNEEERTENGDNNSTFNKNIVNELRNKLKNVWTYSISNSKVNGVECYKIYFFFNKETVYLNKDNGTIVRTISKDNEIVDCSFDFDSVTDNDFSIVKEVDEQ